MVWVGFDDNRELNLEGAQSAAPIWAEFMKRASRIREYRDTKPFRAPERHRLDRDRSASGYAGTAGCPKRPREVYIAGTQPVGACPLHGGRPGITTVAGWDSTAPPAATPAPADTAPTFTGTGGDGVASPDSAARRAARQAGGPTAAAPGADPLPTQNRTLRRRTKKGIFQRIFGVFK